MDTVTKLGRNLFLKKDFPQFFLGCFLPSVMRLPVKANYIVSKIKKNKGEGVYFGTGNVYILRSKFPVSFF